MSRVLPILFNTEMVLAILDDRKTNTRRVIKKSQCNRLAKIEPRELIEDKEYLKEPWCSMTDTELIKSLYKPPCRRGDILYVRETWGISNLDYDDKIAYIVYRASEKMENEGCQAIRLPDEKFEKLYDSMSESSADWRPSIHMLKEAARIWLKVTDVRAERINDMTLDDFLKEGVMIRPEAFNDSDNAYMQAKDAFIDIWDSTIRKPDLKRYGWDADPWVWVIEFERCEKPEEE